MSWLVGVAVLKEEDMVILLPVGSRMVISRLMSDVEIACGAKHRDTLFGYSHRVIILLYGVTSPILSKLINSVILAN